MLQVNHRIAIPDEDLHWTYTRSSGPGGQNVNKVNSKAVLHWNVSAAALPPGVRERFLDRFANRITGEGLLVLSSQRYRDAPRNAADCLEKLRAMLLSVATAPRPRKATKPTRSSVRRRRADKTARSTTKQQRRSVRDDG